MNAIPTRHTLRIETPEGVVVNLVRGSAADRAVAFVIDMGILLTAIIAMMMVSASLGSLWVLAFFVSLTFLLRIFYFVAFEAGRRGATLGKRLMKLRVVRADGGQLTIDAVLTRNFTRELEIFLPLTFLFAHEHFWVGHSGWVKGIASLWILLIPTMPIWSRARVRLGDLVGGTRVVRAPQALLLADMARRRQPVAGSAVAPATELTFTAAQLGIYGIYELQVLEDVLRKKSQPGGKEAMAAVAARIKTKIRWSDAVHGKSEDQTFLEQFYAAQRKHLEQQLLFGKRKERKKG